MLALLAVPVLPIAVPAVSALAEDPATCNGNLLQTSSTGAGYASGLAVDRLNGFVYVNHGGLVITKYDLNLNPLTSWTAAESTMRGVAVDADGNVYAAAGYNSNTLRKFDGNGNPVNSFGGGTTNEITGFNVVGDIALDPAGNIYVAEFGVSLVKVFDPSGFLLATWTPGFQAHSIAVNDSGTQFYVTDYTNKRVVRFDENGNQEIAWGSAGSGEGQFANQTFGIAVNESDDVYTTERTPNQRVQKFDEDGNYLFQWGGFNSAVVGIDADADGNIYVGDGLTGQVKKYGCVPTPTPSPSPTPPTGDYKDILTFSLQTLGQGPAAFDGIDGVELRVYDVSASDFTGAYGAGFAQWKTKLDQIYNGSVTPISWCVTDDDGACTAYKSVAGNYLVIGEYVDEDTGKTVYVSKNELAADFNADKENFADLKIIKKYDKSGAVDYGPAGQVVVVTSVAQLSPGLLQARIGALSVGSLLWLLVGFVLGLAFENRDKLFRKR